MSLPAKNCTRCVWAEPVALGKNSKYECHLNPPTVLYADGRNVPFYAYPQVTYADWCSQHLDTDAVLQQPVEQDGTQSDTEG